VDFGYSLVKIEGIFGKAVEHDGISKEYMEGNLSKTGFKV
jgi:hypothetical protein